MKQIEFLLREGGAVVATDIGVRVVHDNPFANCIDIYVDGYGLQTMDPGKGPVLHLEYYNGQIVARAWTDINHDDYTHKIVFDRAKEALRPPSDDAVSPSPAMEDVANLVEHLAAALSTVLLQGHANMPPVDRVSRMALVKKAEEFVHRHARKSPFTVLILDENLNWLGPFEVMATDSSHAVHVAGVPAKYDVTTKTYHSVVMPGHQANAVEFN